MELKDVPGFRVNGEMRKPGISQQAELVVQRLFVWISRLLPIRPVVELKAKHLPWVRPHEAFTRQWVGSGKTGLGQSPRP